MKTPQNLSFTLQLSASKSTNYALPVTVFDRKSQDRCKRSL